MVQSMLEAKNVDVNILERKATEFSYMLSMMVDVETAQVDAYEGCVESDAKRDPQSTCVAMVAAPAVFSLYSDSTKM